MTDTTPYMRQSLMGVPNGVAILDGTGNVPLDELGNAPGGGGAVSITGAGESTSPGALEQNGGWTVLDPNNEGVYLLGANGHSVLVLQQSGGESVPIQLIDFAGGGINIASDGGDVTVTGTGIDLNATFIELNAADIFLYDLAPSTDPLNSGQAWNNHGVVMVSSGTAEWVDISGSLLNGWALLGGGEAKYKIQGSVVYVVANLDGSSATGSTWAVLPAPVTSVYPGLCLGSIGSGVIPCTHSVDTSGDVATIAVNVAGDIPLSVYTAFSYVVD